MTELLKIVKEENRSLDDINIEDMIKEIRCYCDPLNALWMDAYLVLSQYKDFLDAKEQGIKNSGAKKVYSICNDYTTLLLQATKDDYVKMTANHFVCSECENEVPTSDGLKSKLH